MEGRGRQVWGISGDTVAKGAAETAIHGSADAAVVRRGPAG